MSRKGVTHKPLVDLRNHEIREIIALARYMEVEIQEDKIVVHVIKSQVHTESLSDRELLSMLDEKENLTFEISKEDLLTKDEALMDMLRCAGLFSTKEKSDLQYVFDVASLFSGAGLLDYPFAKDDSFDIKFACDFDKSAVESYKHNIGDHILCMDMRDLDAEQVPDIDLIIGGPCCQGYSKHITWEWVRGHNGDQYNEMCDALCTEAMNGSNLKIDKGYAGQPVAKKTEKTNPGGIYGFLFGYMLEQ